MNVSSPFIEHCNAPNYNALNAIVPLLLNRFHQIQTRLSSFAAKQTFLLYASQLSMTGFGALAYLLMTRGLTKEAFGDREVIMRLTVFISIFFEFGIFSAGSRLLALEKDKDREARLVSTLLGIGAVMALGLTLVLMLAAALSPFLFRTAEPITLTLLLFAFPLSLTLFKFLFQQIYQGANAIYKLAFYNFSVQAAFFALLAALYGLNFFSVTTTLFAYSLPLIIVTGFLLWKAQTSLRHYGEFKSSLVAEFKSFGLTLYVARVISVATQNIDALIIAAYFSSTSAGGYAVMLFFVAPVMMFSDAFLSVFFKRLSQLPHIPATVLVYNFLAMLGIACVYGLFGSWIFEWLFPKYHSMLPLFVPLLCAMVINGLYKPYNYFLIARGESKLLLIGISIASTVTLSLNFLLISQYAETGAAYSQLIGAGIQLTTSWVMYRVYLRRQR
jgi:O-antigen/teichoic acid export membrane protein